MQIEKQKKQMKKPSFSTKIDLSLKEKLKEDLKNQGFAFSRSPYTIFLAKKQGITCALYESGALVIQGKKKEAFIEFYLEPEILKNFQYTCPEAYTNLTPHIGVDEAGKGDFFGPLCIGAVFADEKGIKKLLSLQIKDSKKVSDTNILKLSKEIKKHFSHVLVRLFPSKYNELHIKFKNLNYLLGWGHATAIANLFIKTNCRSIFIDQFAHKSLVKNALAKKDLSLDLHQQHRGEADPVVAAAAILARASFLEGLQELSDKFHFPLPKGASHIVIEKGKQLVEKFGENILEKVAKTHFKTMKNILSSHHTP